MVQYRNYKVDYRAENVKEGHYVHLDLKSFSVCVARKDPVHFEERVQLILFSFQMAGYCC